MNYRLRSQRRSRATRPVEPIKVEPLAPYTPPTLSETDEAWARAYQEMRAREKAWLDTPDNEPF